MRRSRREFLGAGMALAAVACPFARQRPDPADLAWHVHLYTNQQRAWRGLEPVEWSEALAELARAHSADMLARRFFDHRNPDGLGPVERAARRGVHLEVSENLYRIRGGPDDASQLASMVVEGWMKTRGHRRNILAPHFVYAGVGALGDRRGLLVTQVLGA